MHKLLLRQLKRLKQKGTEHIDFTDEAWDQFLNSISDSYEQADKDKEMIERSLKLASDELTQRNRDLRKSIKELNHNQELIKFQANHDALTKLPNRSFFMSQVEQSLTGVDSNNQLAIFFVDLDNFKWVNDNFGHQLGDELLCIVTQRLVSCLRKHDLLARFGGDEFVVLVGGFNDDSVVGKMGLRFLEEVSKPCQLGGQKFHVSVSIGVSLYPEDGNDVDALICKADQAMYQAKEAGRNRFKYFSRPRDQG